MILPQFNMHDFCICANSDSEGKGIGIVPQTSRHERLKTLTQQRCGMFTYVSPEQGPLVFAMRNRMLQTSVVCNTLFAGAAVRLM